jgi:hypothetical protein
VTLREDFRAHHVHNGGGVFQVSLRGTGEGVGRRVEIKMWRTGSEPWAGALANEDDHDPVVGAWIEVAWAEIREVTTRGRPGASVAGMRGS